MTNEILTQNEHEQTFAVTALGRGVLAANLPPEEGLLVYLDLFNANKKLILANDLHLMYLLTPIMLDFRPNWNLLHRIYKRLLPLDIKIADQIGVDEQVIVMFAESKD